MPINIMHITNAYPYAGTPEYGIFVKEQIDSLPQDETNNDVVFINGRANGKKAYIDAVREIRSKVNQYDVIHCHHAYSFIVAALSGVVGKRPIVLSFLNDWTYEVKDLRLPPLKKLICRICVKLSSKVIFKSPIPNELHGSTKAVNLPNGVDSDFFHIQDRVAAKIKLGLDPQKTYFLFVSSKNQYREQKRYDLFSKVLKHAQELSPNREIKEYVMVGQPRDTIPTVFSACDIHILTSDYEGSPNSVKESLCCGTPVISRDVGNVNDMLQGVKGTVVLKTADPVLIAESAVAMLDSAVDPSDVRDSFLQKGITKVLISQKLVAIYKDLAGTEKQ